jgi:hypothetical protein
VKKEQNGRKSLRRLKPTVGCNVSKRRDIHPTEKYIFIIIIIIYLLTAIGLSPGGITHLHTNNTQNNTNNN